MKKASFYADAFLLTFPNQEDMVWIGALSNKKIAKKIKNFAYLSGFAPKELTKNLEMPRKVANLICLLGTQNMLAKTSEVIEKIKTQSFRVGFEFAEVSFAGDDFNEDQLHRIMEKLGSSMKSRAIISTLRDKSLLSGFRVKLSNQSIDLSLKNKIKQFSKQLLS